MKNKSFRNQILRRFAKKTPPRPRREGCVGSRVRAVLPAAARLGFDGSAAGERGTRGAGRPAAPPEGRTRPGLRLQCVALPLRDVQRTPRHAAARPLRLRDGARRGEGGSKPGGARLVQGGTLRLAAAAVPRLAGTVPLRGGKAITCQINLNLCIGCNLCIRNISNQFKLCKSHSYLYTSFCSRTQLPLSVVAFFWTVTCILLWQAVWHCAVWHLPRTCFQKSKFHCFFHLVTLKSIWFDWCLIFRPLWRGTLEKLETCASCTMVL